MLIGTLSANQIKFIASLQQKKYRQKYNKFVVEGEKIVTELLKFHKDACLYLVVSEELVESWDRMPETKGIDIFSLPSAAFSKISSMSTPPPVLALVDTESLLSEPRNKTVLYLDALRDPGNMGTVIRLADWFGLGAVCCSPQCVEVLNPKVIQATMGSIFRVPILFMDLQTLKNENADLPIVTLDMEGSPIDSTDFPTEAIFVIGGESHGVSVQVSELSDIQLTIPKHSGGDLPESLNAANAAAILAYEIRRNR